VAFAELAVARLVLPQGLPVLAACVPHTSLVLPQGLPVLAACVPPALLVFPQGLIQPVVGDPVRVFASESLWRQLARPDRSSFFKYLEKRKRWVIGSRGLRLAINSISVRRLGHL
jgi:hypothetical protein